MNLRTLRTTLAAIALALVLSSAAQAQVFRAYLAPTGNDANPCTLAAPCRLLPAALAAVANGGEVWMLDSANYNTATVTIAKSVSILAVPGAVGSVLAIGGPAIQVTADNLRIGLRNLVVTALVGGGGTTGVEMTGASRLTVEHCLFSNLPNLGVYVRGEGGLRIANSTFRDNTSYAVWLQDGATGTIAGTQMLGNGNGGILAYSFSASLPTVATVSDSVISGGVYGLRSFVDLVAPGTTRISATRTTIEGTQIALHASNVNGNLNAAQLVLSSSLVTRNTSPYEIAAATVYSLGNNHIHGNELAGNGALTPLASQ